VTLNQRLEAFLKARPGVWIAATDFESVAGRQAWRSRLSDVRRKRGMTIENRQRWIELTEGRGYTLSEYRFVPTLPAGQATLFEAAQI
jgi:hypothetical protein